MQSTLKQLPKDSGILNATELGTTLVLEDCSPFSEESVKIYKDEMVAKHPASFWYRNRVLFQKYVGVCGAVGEDGLKFGMYVGLVALCVAVLNLNAGQQPLFTSSFFMGALVFCAWTICCLFLLMVERLADKITLRGPASWKRDTLYQYRLSGKDIPKDAHEMAQNIKSTFPRAIFWVEELVQDSVVLDPFLYVMDPKTNERHYIAQWNEPLFQKTK